MGRLNTDGRCPKCRGNLYLDRDYNGWYEECLQCGFIKDLAVVYEHKRQMPEQAGDGNKKKDVPAEE
jgi:Zn ribbon nucleic-acid-binding protein